MIDEELSARDATAILGISQTSLRSQLRRNRPTGARQVPPQKGGNWLLQWSFVAQLTSVRGLRIPLQPDFQFRHLQKLGNGEPTASNSTPPVGAAWEGHRIWSP